jgi:ribosomal protein S18 acetylase RimI-like enzyme
MKPPDFLVGMAAFYGKPMRCATPSTAALSSRGNVDTAEAVHLVVARAADEFAAARMLFEEYAEGLGVDLCFQNFSSELERLPSMYGPPGGSLILAQLHQRFVGCVGIRPLARVAGACEMKRLYVREEARGSGIGRLLAVRSIEAAREMGYQRMLLDTLGRMVAARALYAQLGFHETGAYYANPNDDVKYLELAL